MTEQIKKLKELVDGSDNIVFFGGAGVSTESGIPDFRSTDGLYHQQWDYPPEVILSHTFYESNPEAFFRFYRAKMLAPDAQPNDAHRKLAQWEQEGKLKAVITQNIDGLHQAAGSKNVLELHGSVHRNHCQRCGKFYPLDALLHGEGVPRCTCGGVIKPDVVLYEESLDQDVLNASVHLSGGHAHHRRHLIERLACRRAHQLLPRPQAGAHQQIPRGPGPDRGPGDHRAHRPDPLLPVSACSA